MTTSRYQPALDGVRGLAVAAVLLFHAEVGWASGGYLGVSVFFTLSGFLIAGLLVDEQTERSRLDLRRFYARRIRRLLPASAATLVLVVVLSRAHAFSPLHPLGTQMRWVTLQAANWYQLRSGQSYATTFTGNGVGGASPLQHFWSLAIEEQFYLVLPLLLVAYRRLRGRPLGWPAALAGYLAAALAAVLIARHGGVDAAYYNTFARAGELLSGVLLAVVVRRWTPARWLQWVAVVAAVVIAVLCATTGTGPSSWPYHGALPLFGLLTAVFLWGLQVPGPMQRCCSAAPLVVVGRISYGLYLYHWPVYVWLNADRTGLGTLALLALRLAVTAALAIASYLLMEHPVRRRTGPPVRTFVAALTTTIALLATSLAVPTFASAATEVDQIDPSVLAAASIPPETTATASTAGSTTAPTPRPLRVLVVGDSTAVALGSGLVDWVVHEHPDMQVSLAASGACGLVPGGRYRSDVFNAALDMTCAHLFSTDLPASLDRLHPDVVLLSITLADTWDRSFDGGVTWLRPTDPEFRTRIEAAYQSFADVVIAAGVRHLVWLRPPVSSYATNGGSGEVDLSFTDGSQALIETTVRAVAQRHPEVQVFDFRRWFEQSPLLVDAGARPDGTHLTPAAATEVARDWLGPHLLALAH